MRNINQIYIIYIVVKIGSKCHFSCHICMYIYGLVLESIFRIVFGTTQYFVFCNPVERDSSSDSFPDITFEMAQEELAICSGFDVDMHDKSRGIVPVQWWMTIGS